MNNQKNHKADKDYSEKFIPTKENLKKVKKAFDDSREKSINKKNKPDTYFEVK